MLREAAEAVSGLSFNSSTYILVFLPALLFQAALTIDVRRMMEDAAPSCCWPSSRCSWRRP